MSSTPIYTAQDLYEYLLDLFDYRTGTTSRSARIARHAVNDAIRAVSVDGFIYNKRYASLTTSPIYSDGTVSYNAATRALTLSGGTWPTDARYGWVWINDSTYGGHYRVDLRNSDTELTLFYRGAPEGNITGAAYQWYRFEYPLPVDFIRLEDDAVDSQNGQGGLRQMEWMEPDMFLRRLRAYGIQSSGTPEFFSVGNIGEYYSQMQLLIGPPSSDARQYEYPYLAGSRSVRTFVESTGTVSIAAGDPDITGSGTNFQSYHVGSVIRFSSNANVPTPIAGSPGTSEDNSDGTYNPFVEERVIASVSSTTSATVDETISSTLNAVGYVISDPIDVQATVLEEYLQALASETVARLDRRPDTNDFAAAAMRARKKAFRDAKTVAVTRSASYLEQGRYSIVGNVDHTPGV